MKFLKGGPACRQTGFTLVEMLVVVVIGALLVVAGVNSFLSSLSGGGKASLMTYVKENGDYAIGQMERMIRDVEEVDTVVTDGSPATDCSSGNWTNLLRLNKPDGTSVQFGIEGERIVVNDGGSLRYLMAEDIAVDDGGGGTGIFRCTAGEGYATIIQIRFRLTKGDPTEDRQAEYAQETFQTQVMVRKF